MMVRRKRIRHSILVIGCLFMLGCNLARVTSDTPITPLDPTSPPADVVEPGDSSSDGWELLAPGIERQDMAVRLEQSLSTEAVVIRVDPTVAAIRVHYYPGEAQTIEQWGDRLSDAEIIVNGAFFDENERALGLIISDGTPYGQSLSGFGGMFQVDNGGNARVRSLVGEPYAGESLYQAVQGFPMLIEAGGVMAPQGEGFNERSRRTAVGQDVAGRIVFISISYGFVSLAELQEWLMQSGLDLIIAVGLDGGRSTGMAINTSVDSETFPSLDRVPSVVAVYAP